METKLERELFRGSKYVDALNYEAYCIACSLAFASFGKLPDGVVDEIELLT